MATNSTATIQAAIDGEAKTNMNGEAATVQTVRDLRRRWKPHKERLLNLGGEQATSIRFHRVCSWMGRVEQMSEGQDHDLMLAVRSMLPRSR